MIVSNLIGGLGNNLFQIAASIGTANFYGNDWRIQGNWKYRSFFSIPEEYYIDEYKLQPYKESHFHYALIPNGNWELNGYFQSYKYFNYCKDLINLCFKFWKEWDDKPAEDVCAIHIRGGDYLKLSEYHYNLQTDYYERAMEQSGFSKFIIFTDDPEHAKKILPDIPQYRQGHEVYDLTLLAKYNGIIMANSSFSWWGAYLSEAKVIAPKTWFGALKSHYILSDLYLPEWTIVNY